MESNQLNLFSNLAVCWKILRSSPRRQAGRDHNIFYFCLYSTITGFTPILFSAEEGRKEGGLYLAAFVWLCVAMLL